jgi:hypothetical protein
MATYLAKSPKWWERRLHAVATIGERAVDGA